MAIWLLHPFKNQQSDPAFKDDQRHLKDAGMDVKFIDRPSMNTLLPKVGDSDLLIISGHGDVNDGNLYLKGDDEDVKDQMTASDLAKGLEHTGLKKTHESILLLTCCSGDSSKARSKAGPAPELTKTEKRMISKGAQPFRKAPTELLVSNNKATQCLASILAKALGQRKYFSIVVGGWPGSVVQADSGKFGNLFFIEPDAVSATNPLYVSQLDHIQWFDCKGKNTAQS
jgi:hypothetical protein